MLAVLLFVVAADPIGANANTASTATPLPAGIVEVPSLGEIHSIAGKWLFHEGDDLAWAAPDFDDAGWEPIQVPRGIGLQGHRDLIGHFWYRVHVHAPRPRGNDQLSIHISDVDSAYEMYVDGYYVGGKGKVTEPHAVDDSSPGQYRVPNGALDDGEMVVAIRAWRSPLRQDAQRDRGGITSGAEIVGPTDALSFDFVVHDVPTFVLAGIFIIVGLYHVQLFRRRRELTEYLWFGVFSVVISAYVIAQGNLIHQVLENVWMSKIALDSVFIALPVFVQFLWPFLRTPIRWWWRVWQAVDLAWFVATTLWPTDWLVHKYLLVWEIFFLLPLAGGTVALLVRRVWQGDPEAKTISIGVGLLVVTSINNVLRTLNVPTPEITNWTFAAFVLSMAVSLSNRFSRVYSELDMKNVELIKMDKLKDEFLANTSHELRTPIHGIIGLAQSLIDGVTGTLPKSTVENLDMIVMSGDRLAGLVNDILDFSKLKEGQIALELASVDMHSAVDVVCRLSKPLADKKGLEIKNDVWSGLPPVRADEHRLQQILFNLVGNALKFTEKGTVTVSATPVGADKIRVDVVDTGIGIDPKDHARIFESFQQADGSTSRVYGGTGLGLTVTKRLVELHHGEVGIESTVGRGSRFWFTLPVDDTGAAAIESKPHPDFERRLIAAPAVSVPDEPSGSGIVRPASTSAAVPTVRRREQFKVLVVDDEPVNVKVLENHLAFSDYEVRHASSGPEALGLVDKGFVPDLILLDVMMPRMSGFEVCQTLRAKYPATELPVVLVTAKNQEKDMVAGFDMGANDYLTKPVAKNELLARIRTHLHVAKMNAATARFVPYEFLSLLGKETLIDIKKGDQIEKRMAILFSDIRSFTTIVEKKTPEENFAFVNHYMEHMEPAILENGGFIDSFIGDAIMALFEEGGLQAVRAGIAMQKRMPAFNAERTAKGEVPIKIGIGVNTGELMLGTIGGVTQIKCGVIGDSVNLASRIEGMTKMYGASFLVSASTKEGAENEATYREVDVVQAKGKNEPTTIYEVLDADEPDVRDRKLRTLARYNEGIALYRARKFVEAEKLFAEGAADDAVFALYRDRAARFRDEPPPPEWNAVVRLDSK